MDRIKNAYNAFRNNRDPTFYSYDTGTSYYRRPDRVRLSGGNERSIVTSIINKIATDAAAIDIEHVRLDENGRYIKGKNITSFVSAFPISDPKICANGHYRFTKSN